MVVPAGGAWLAVHVLLLLLLLLAAKTVPVSTELMSPSSMAFNVSDEVDNYRHHHHHSEEQQQQQQADSPQPQPHYRGQEDIQVGCRELRAKRYISDGFCTSIKPIKEVVCAGNCLPIMDLPWYAEFVKIWAKPKLRDWQCEEDVVRRKSVHLLCRNGEYRTYRIKVVKSCKCKRSVDKHNRTVSSEGKKKKKKRKKDKRRRGKKRRRGGEKSVRRQERGEDGSQPDQRQEYNKEAKEKKGRKRDRKQRKERKKSMNSGGQVKSEDVVRPEEDVGERQTALSDVDDVKAGV